MPGTKAGGKLAAARNIAKYGPDYYAKIGAMGGSRGNTGGLYKNPKKASKIGKLGGARSKRGYKIFRDAPEGTYYIDMVTQEVVLFAANKAARRRKRVTS